MLRSLYWWILTFRDNLSVPSSRVKQTRKILELVNPATDILPRNVCNYQSTLSNIPEQRRSYVKNVNDVTEIGNSRLLEYDLVCWALVHDVSKHITLMFKVKKSKAVFTNAFQ